MRSRLGQDPDAYESTPGRKRKLVPSIVIIPKTGPKRYKNRKIPRGLLRIFHLRRPGCCCVLAWRWSDAAHLTPPQVLKVEVCGCSNLRRTVVIRCPNFFGVRVRKVCPKARHVAQCLGDRCVPCSSQFFSLVALDHGSSCLLCPMQGLLRLNEGYGRVLQPTRPEAPDDALRVRREWRKMSGCRDRTVRSGSEYPRG